VNGQTLKFQLAGINNQNFIMRDAETGSWWQQISGEAIQGSLKGQKLTEVASDELSFAVWKRENPAGRVLRPDARILAEQKYDPADWEDQVGKMRVTTSAELDNTLEPRTLVVGITINGKSKAYPFSSIVKQSPILDFVGGKDIVILISDDNRSVRAFERELDGSTLEFLRKTDTAEIVDAETGSTWDFTGKAVSGKLTGKQLVKIPTLKDYWFDWKTYHNETQLYTYGFR
jgi:Protein of unknown function (DUF3179)